MRRMSTAAALAPPAPRGAAASMRPTATRQARVLMGRCTQQARRWSSVPLHRSSARTCGPACRCGWGGNIHSWVHRSRKYLRAGAQAYPDAASLPAAVGLNVSLLGFPPAVFSAAALGSMRSLVAAVLSAHLSPLIQVRTCHACMLTSDSDDSDLVSVALAPRQASDLLCMAVASPAALAQSEPSLRRALGVTSNASTPLTLTLWLLLEPSSGIQAFFALAAINQPSTQVALADAVSRALAVYTSAPLSVSTSLASSVPLLPAVSGRVAATPSDTSAPPPAVAAAVAVTLILGIPLAAYLVVVLYTRSTGRPPPCCYPQCTGPVVLAATCCGRCPLRMQQPTPPGRTGGYRAKTGRAALHVEMLRPPQQWGVRDAGAAASRIDSPYDGSDDSLAPWSTESLDAAKPFLQ